MNYPAIFLFAVAMLILMYFANIYLSRFKLIGKANPNSDTDKTPENWQLYYFHAPHCGACKNITPWVVEQSSTHTNIVNVDISKDFDTARKFNIRATPTAVFVEKDIVQDVQLGSSIIITMKEFVEKHG
ncbi:MAG: thioredoxin family protein [Cycloclasticus sp.]|nr:thioredoxin family protein [Cycloclasticus sp.]